ncbi:G2/mitotic-specific cyclin-4 [Diutina catenulata]
MRNYQTATAPVAPVHDENTNAPGHKSKQSLPSSSSREVLSDVTAQKKAVSASAPSALPLKKTKIPVYGASQFKKPRLDPRAGDIAEDDEDEAPVSEDIRTHFDELNVDAELTESNPPTSDVHEFINNSDYDHEDVENHPPHHQTYHEHIDDDDDEEEEVKTPSQAAPLAPPVHRPMEPKWDRAIFDELQYVMQKHSRTTLDEADEDTFDVTMVAEYAPEIFNYMRALETRLAPDGNYMDNQDELKWDMRRVLIDWVVQVHSRFNLLPETLYLTVNYIDRFLSHRKVSLSRFQLVGAVALFIAAKYEEINCPTVQEVAYMADNAYSIDEFLKAERFMIGVLDFDMGWPGPMSFLRRTSKADDYDYETRTLAKYFLEITIVDSRFVASPPSWLAAGAHYLARRLLNKGAWTELHVFYSGYTETQLRPLAEVLINCCRHPEQHHRAIYEKYQERRYRRSSAFVQEYFHTLE